MLEELKSSNLEEVESMIDVLQADIDERKAWLTMLSVPDSKIEFLHKYTRRSIEAFHGRDRRADARLDNAQDKEELTPEAKKEIQALKREMNDIIAIELYNLDIQLEEQFETNEEFIKMGYCDRAAVLADHKRNRINTERRLRTIMNRRIDKINAAPSSRTRDRRDKNSWARIVKERRDKEEIRFCLHLIAEEKRMLLEFESYMATEVLEEPVSESDIIEFREEHSQNVARSIDAERKIFYDNRARRDRMARARHLEIIEKEEDADLTEKRSLLSYYSTKMEEVVPQSEPTIEWYRALRELDALFIENLDNWKQFIDIAVHYWLCLAKPRRRRKWDRIISRYATLSLEGSIVVPEEDVSYNTAIRLLRDRRDRLVSEILLLDERVRSRHTQDRRLQKKISKTRRARLQVVVNYNVTPEPKAETKREARPGRMTDISWKSEELPARPITPRRERGLLLSSRDS